MKENHNLDVKTTRKSLALSQKLRSNRGRRLFIHDEELLLLLPFCEDLSGLYEHLDRNEISFKIIKLKETQFITALFYGDTAQGEFHLGPCLWDLNYFVLIDLLQSIVSPRGIVSRSVEDTSNSEFLGAIL